MLLFSFLVPVTAYDGHLFTTTVPTHLSPSYTKNVPKHVGPLYAPMSLHMRVPRSGTIKALHMWIPHLYTNKVPTHRSPSFRNNKVPTHVDPLYTNKVPTHGSPSFRNNKVPTHVDPLYTTSVPGGTQYGCRPHTQITRGQFCRTFEALNKISWWRHLQISLLFQNIAMNCSVHGAAMKLSFTLNKHLIFVGRAGYWAGFQ